MAKYNISKKANSKSYKSPYSSGKGKYQSKKTGGKSEGTIRAEARAIQGGTGSLTESSLNKAISANSLAPRDVANIPARTTPIDTGLDLNTTNSALGATGGVFELPKMGAQAGDSEGVAAAKEYSNQIASYLGAAADMSRPDANAQQNAFMDTRDELRIREKEAARNKQANIINTITAERDAAQLGLEGQGRGVTDTIIGGQQAKIAREAAIKALPHQALLSAAQGDLDTANALLGQLYQAKSADIAANQAYRTNLASSMMQFATASQQAILSAKQSDIAMKAETAQSNLAYQRQLGLQALEYGQNGLVTGISNIDPSSPTFEQDIAAFTAQLRKPVATTGGGAPTIKTINGVDYQWNPTTGQWEEPTGADSMSGDINGAGGELDKIAMVRDTIARITGREADEELGLEEYDPLYKKASQTPVSEFFGRTFTGSSGLDNLKVYADTLKSNMLTLAADPSIKDFFGPQMSNADVQQMMAVATRMQPDNQTPEQLLSETKRIEQFIGKYEAAVKAKQNAYATPIGGYQTVGPDQNTYIVVPD